MVGIVVGAGIIGMCTAILLQQNGEEIIVIADKFGDQTVSSNAGGLWEPYKANPRKLVNEVSEITLNKWKKEAKLHKDLVVISKVTYQATFKMNNEYLWWINMVDIVESNLLENHKDAVTVMSPIIATNSYLQYLYMEFKKNNGKFINEKIYYLINTKNQYNANYIVNCTGLGSKELLNDNLLSGIGGTIVYLEPNIKLDVSYNFGDTEIYPNENGISSYVIQRPDTIIIGGTTEDEHSPINMDVVNQLITKASELFDKRLQYLPIQKYCKGIRPYRKEIRLELENNNGNYIIHNYGHGGSGWTTCWGCAEKVLNIIQSLPISKL